MLEPFKKSYLFFTAYFVLLLMAIVAFQYEEHGDFVLFLNDRHTPFWDSFFKLFTYGGDVFVFIPIALRLLMKRRRHGYVFLLVGLVQLGVSTFLKQIVFKGVPRPRIYFQETAILNFIDGVPMQDFGSFPSGHTMTAFVMATFLALMLQKNHWSVVLLIGAALVGISRVYLLQHFLIDIIAGSLLGVLITTVFYMSFERYLTAGLPVDPPKKEESNDVAFSEIDSVE